MIVTCEPIHESTCTKGSVRIVSTESTCTKGSVRIVSTESTCTKGSERIVNRKKVEGIY